VGQSIIIIDAPDFRVEFGDDFDVGMIDEFATVYRFPDFLAVFI